MTKYNEINWKSFFLNEVFETIKSSTSQIDRINLIPEKGDFPYVTRTEKNNGISDFIIDQPGYEINPGNVMTIGLDTQTVFYQSKPFFTGQNIQIIEDSHFTENIALFLLPLLKKQLKKFNWGGNGATLSRLNRLKIMIPVDDNQQPAWQFMEEFSNCQRKEMENKSPQIPLNEITDTRELSNVTWKEYKINELFNIFSGVRLTKKQMRTGNIPFIGATDSNNGVTAFVDNINNSIDKNVLGVNYNGSVVENFYHPYSCVFSDDVKRLHLKEYTDNKYVLLFFKTLIYNQKKKFDYGYKFNGGRIKRQILLVPSINDQPDWHFMEQYMKRIENTLINQVNFSDKKPKTDSTQKAIFST